MALMAWMTATPRKLIKARTTSHFQPGKAPSTALVKRSNRSVATVIASTYSLKARWLAGCGIFNPAR